MHAPKCILGTDYYIPLGTIIAPTDWIYVKLW
jgi:hypothetical protein